MEKFGIFELLDTLSALAPEKETQHDAEKTEKNPPVPDGAFAPPSYPDGGNAKTKTSADALQGFLARHDAVARKADAERKS